MKKLSLLLLTLTICFFTSCHKSIWEELENLDQRVTKLEELCKEMNTNITSLQTIVSVLQANDYITGIVEIKKNGEVIGYTITFGKHDPITIYHGEDGKDGQDGANGSSSTPVIGVAKDTDGVYYWTLNGEWLLDDNGNKLPVSGTNGKDGQNGSNGQDGTDGKDGQDGTDGKDGQDGADGKDGVTPQLKIEDGYWYISYDNGATWTQLGKATGEDGKDGADGQDGQNGTDGKDGQDGDSMFQSVTQDENYVYFTLADGTVIKIAKGNDNSSSKDDFIFTITYDANGGIGTMPVDTVYYGYLKTIKKCTYTNEGGYFSEWNTDPKGDGVTYNVGSSITIFKNITLYAQWNNQPPLNAIDLGLSVMWSSCNVGASKPESYGDYFAWGEIASKRYYEWSNYKWGDGSSKILKYNTDSNYGIVDYKTILEPEDDAATMNLGPEWRMPTYAEIQELKNNCTWTRTTYNGQDGYIVKSKINGNEIFLPFAGVKTQHGLVGLNDYGMYWSSELDINNLANPYELIITKSGRIVTGRYDGKSVRAVCPFKNN